MSYAFPLSIVIVDHPGSGAPDAATLTKYAAAMTKGMDGDFAPEYMRTARWRFDTQAGDDEVMCGLFEHPDQPGALGYHDWPPIIKVFPKLDLEDGAELSVTLDHEGKEAVEDLTIDIVVQGQDGHFWADEPADAVEQDSYEIDGVKVSNFVTKSWYSGRDTKYDFLGKLTSPLSVTAGGYCQYFDPAKGWQQITHAAIAPRTYRMREFGRATRRRARLLTCAGVDAKFDV